MRILVLAMFLALGANANPYDAQARRYYEKRNAELHRLWKGGQYEKALRILEELRRDPGVNRLRDKRVDVLYNLACAHARLGDKDSAIDYLEQAEVAGGLRVYEWLLKDPDLAAIRREPEFVSLVQRLKLRSMKPDCTSRPT